MTTRLLAVAGDDESCDPTQARAGDPAKSRRKLLATIDTRPKNGQHAVSIAKPAGAPIGNFRYLLFDVAKTESDDDFGNTFFSEIDVIEQK